MCSENSKIIITAGCEINIFHEYCSIFLDSDEDSDEEIFAITQDGIVMKYAIGNSLYLIGICQMRINVPEHRDRRLQANR